MKPSISIYVESRCQVDPDSFDVAPGTVWSAELVAAILGDYMGARRVFNPAPNVGEMLAGCGFLDVQQVVVTVTADNPAWAGEDTLPGMPPVARHITTVAHPFRQPVTAREVTA